MTGENRRFLAVLEGALLAAPFLLGLFFPWGSALMSIVLAALLLTRMNRRGLLLTGSPLFCATCALVLSLLLGCFWGTDHGMALVGAVQFLPLPLLVMALEQVPSDERERLFDRLPIAAGVMTLVALLLGAILGEESGFLISGRLAGFFQYPNTFALYLLAALVFVLFRARPRERAPFWPVVLIAGIFLSGSRTVFVLLLAVLAVWCFREKDRRHRMRLLLPTATLLLAGLGYAAFVGRGEAVSRFLTISPSASEFLGRLLYARDAVPVILKHPLGLGYSGYYWLQGSFQTGVYTVQHVHNDLLQVFLDAGWIPGGLLLWAFARELRRGGSPLWRRMLIAVMALHCLLDFDMQFAAMGMYLVLALDQEPQAGHLVKFRLPAAALLGAAAVVSLWIGSAAFLHYLQEDAAALRVYPGYTTARVSLLAEGSREERIAQAMQILRENPNVAEAYDALAEEAFRQGDFDAVTKWKENAIRLAKYSGSEYREYFAYLRSFYDRALQNGDRETAAQCMARMQAIPQMMQEVIGQTSALGWKIKDRPSLSLPESDLLWLNGHRS